MAQPPPRPAASLKAGPVSAGPNSNAAAVRASSGDKDKLPGTFFLGRYRVVDEIGVGGMASVHLARMDGPGGFQKWVAIKRIHPHLVEDDQFVDMFLDEARIAAGINHANVAQVFDLGKDDNTYWIAMEYLHGEPLREVMRRAEERRTLIAPELVARIGADAADGLHAAHELRGKNGQLLGLVHRDVTPHNLFLTYDGYTKVVDFGIAKVADRLSSTRAGTLKGKLAYMSPEQVRGAEIDRRTDIFALGVVLWEATTNQRLFRMDTDLDTLEKVQACAVPPPSTMVRGYPPELEAVVMKALAKNKEDRYQTARELSRALQGYLMRSGNFVDCESVAGFVREMFGDRIQKREAHLAWASEVTSTVDVDKLRAKPQNPNQDRDDRLGTQDPGGRSPAGGQSSAPPPHAMLEPAPLASASLLDDDEDLPTTVATREQLAEGPPRFGSRAPAIPAAGAPGAMNAVPRVSVGGPPSPPSNRAHPGPSYAAQPAHAAFTPGFGRPQIDPSERTAAIPAAEDLGSTMALPPHLFGPEQRPSPHYGAQSYAAFNGQPVGPQGYAMPPPGMGANTYPPGAINPQFSPMGMVGGVPMNAPMAMPAQPQSQIETALSLPRPDPAAVWMAHQANRRAPPRNVGVLLAVLSLTAVCVSGIGALVYFKYVKGRSAQAIGDAASVISGAAPSAAAQTTPVASATIAASAGPPQPALSDSAATTAIATAAASAPPPAPSAAPNVAAAPPKPAPVPANVPVAALGSKDLGKEEPGYLTILCQPYCDNVQDQGRSLGPSPIIRLAAKPGAHRITVQMGTTSKVVSVIVVSGQVSAQRITMK